MKSDTRISKKESVSEKQHTILALDGLCPSIQKDTDLDLCILTNLETNFFSTSRKGLSLLPEVIRG